MTAPLRALDLFAGTGWGVACQELGIEEFGVELMPEARATREAAGMRSAGYDDVWDGLVGESPFRVDYDLLIASPPCQTFSMAGRGAGRAALNDVLAAIDDRVYEDPERLHGLTESLDPRTALVLTPLAHVFRDRPRFVVFEQVPTVLPVWEACAAVMRDLGYSVEAGILHAEQFGVPQTRKRAILVARLDGVTATLPTPTHSRYHGPGKRDVMDPGVLPWVSMATALGWDTATSRVAAKPQTAKRTEIWGERPDRPATDPAFTIVGHDGHPRGGFEWRDGVPESAGKVMGRGMVERHGDRPDRPIDDPAFTVRGSAGGMEPGGFVWKWGDHPAATIAGDSRLAERGHHERQMNNALRLTIHEASVLQTYPPEFPFQGTKAKRFLQVGNAVPPMLGKAVLSAFRVTESADLELPTFSKHVPVELIASLIDVVNAFFRPAVHS